MMKGVASAMTSLDQKQIAEFEKSGSLSIEIEGQTLNVDIADVEIINEDIPGWLVSNEGNLTVALDVELTDELLKEGMARELINRIQNMRKEMGLEITDRIKITVAPNQKIEESISVYKEYVQTQVLADNITIGENDGEEVDFDDFTLNIKIEKS